MITIPNNSNLGALDTLRTTKMVTPVGFNAIGTFANQVNLYIDACIEQIYGDLAPHLPVALRGLDSAQGTKDLKISLPGSPPRPAPPGLVTLYRDHSVSALRAQAERAKGTRPLADKLGRLPAMETLANGCCQKPAFGQALYLANLQAARESIVSALLRTRDANHIAACENAGFKVKPTQQIVMVRFVNGAGSTGSGAEVLDAMMMKLEAAQRGLAVANHVFILLPSAGASLNPQAARENAGKLLLEVAFAVEHPEQVVAHSFDGQSFRYADGPIYDSVTTISVSTHYQAAGNRHELAARLALLGATFISTPFLAISDEQFADSKSAMGDRRHGLPAFRRMGFERAYFDHHRNLDIAKAAATAHFTTNV